VSNHQPFDLSFNLGTETFLWNQAKEIWGMTGYLNPIFG